MSKLGVKWNYYRRGDRSGVPLIYLHGFMGSGKIWLPLMPRLPESICLIAPDLPGHGGTEAELNDLDFDSLSEALIDFIDQNSFDKPIIAGYSMGGRIALYTALKYRQKFRAMILESTTAGIENETDRRERFIHDQNMAEKLRQEDMKIFLENWYKQPVFAYLGKSVKDGIIQKKTSNDPDKLARVVTLLSPGIQPSLWEDLPKWDKPALIIAGELDRKYVEISEKMTANIKSAKLEIIKKAGHIVHLENLKEYSSVLNSFIRSYIL